MFIIVYKRVIILNGLFRLHLNIAIKKIYVQLFHLQTISIPTQPHTHVHTHKHTHTP